MNIPEVEQCFELMDRYGMLPNIREHSVMVALVAWKLVEELELHTVARPYLPDKKLVVTAALLHDIAKTHCLADDCDHAEVGGEILRDHGFDELAEIAEEHVVLKSHDSTRYQRGCFWAKDIVYYADKRVLHEKVVSLDDRLVYIVERYGRRDERLHELIRRNFAKCVSLEEFLFSFISYSPDFLSQKIRNPGNGVSFSSLFDDFIF
ncbi:MAG: HDIG domain-containing protein [Desulfobulbaceae bacterium]|nr:HDIG domain-containing protein [Desulfobulbaceae bacterium]